jgi:hypothetical protein
MPEVLTAAFEKNLKLVEKEFQPELELFEQHVKDVPETTCPWHRLGAPGHKGNFGLMNECLDCMAEINEGKCEVNVKNFKFDLYWIIKSFWEKVDIKGPDECWLWKGATKKKESDTVAYMPSPFHSAKTQSAARVAFWLSRGYTGRYRIVHNKTCHALCCNPLHLHLKGVELKTQPTEISVVNLSYGNIFSEKSNVEGI